MHCPSQGPGRCIHLLDLARRLLHRVPGGKKKGISSTDGKDKDEESGKGKKSKEDDSLSTGTHSRFLASLTRLMTSLWAEGLTVTVFVKMNRLERALAPCLDVWIELKNARPW